MIRLFCFIIVFEMLISYGCIVLKCTNWDFLSGVDIGVDITLRNKPIQSSSFFEKVASQIFCPFFGLISNSRIDQEMEKMEPSLPRATLLFTEARNFPSTIMGINYQISISFPPSYPEANRKYPVIYLLDGEMNIGLMSGIVFGLVYGQLMPECLIVGVGHDINMFDEWWRARAVDFSPPENPKVTYPEWAHSFKDRRAPDFLCFLKNELIPFIESTYPADPADRCLAGYSLGGQFAIYSLFHEPDLFHKYFIGSGIWEHSLPDYLAYEEQLARQRKSLPVHAFFSVGSLEDDQAPYFPLFIEALKRRHYADFCLESLVFEGENHGSCGALAIIKGLRALYSSNKKTA